MEEEVVVAQAQFFLFFFFRWYHKVKRFKKNKSMESGGIEIGGEVVARVRAMTGYDVDELLKNLKRLGEERAKYRAQFYSSFSGTSISDERRKILKAECIRRLLRSGEKLAANLIEALAYDDPEYRSFVQAQEQSRIAFEMIDAEYKYVESALETVKAMIFFMQVEMKLGQG